MLFLCTKKLFAEETNLHEQQNFVKPDTESSGRCTPALKKLKASLTPHFQHCAKQSWMVPHMIARLFPGAIQSRLAKTTQAKTTRKTRSREILVD